MKKKEDISEYCTAGDAAHILTLKLQRTVRPDYISKMARTKRHKIRCAHVGDRILYHREDVAACSIRQKTK
jgi:hypothetical protein